MNPQGFTLVILDTARHPRGRKYSHFAHKETDVQKGYTANLATELAGAVLGLELRPPEPVTAWGELLSHRPQKAHEHITWQGWPWPPADHLPNSSQESWYF